MHDLVHRKDRKINFATIFQISCFQDAAVGSLGAITMALWTEVHGRLRAGDLSSCLSTSVLRFVKRKERVIPR